MKTLPEISELEKLESKRDEMQAEIYRLKPMQIKKLSVIPVIIRLSTMLCDCDQMIANTRASSVNKKRTRA